MARGNKVTIELPDGAIEAALGRILMPENEGIYDKSADGTELPTERQKARRYLETAVYVPAGKKWLVERTAADDIARKKARLGQIDKDDEKAANDAAQRQEEKDSILLELEGPDGP